MTLPTYAEMVRVFGRIGVLSFGGPAAQIALMERELVEERPWLEERSFLRALSLCMLLPGPEAMQLATYCGWRLRGVPGGLLAGLLFVLPGALVIACLVGLYAAYGDLPLVQSVFLGVKAAVVVIVLQALRNLARRALSGRTDYVIAGLGFLALFALNLPFPLVIAAAALWGLVTARAEPQPDRPPRQAARPLQTLCLWSAIWLLPLIALSLSGQILLSEIGWFFAKLAVVTFGGAYAVLAYMTQAVVQEFNWISTAQMIDALGLAETTPGPLILVTQFVAMLTGQLQGGAGLALLAGLVALWATFAPCFLWIFLAAPYLDRIAAQPRLASALRAISAAVVGVILNLSVWFALHVLFDNVNTDSTALISLPLPDPATFNPRAAVMILAAMAIMWGLKQGLGRTLSLLALAGAASHYI
ncbi:chromate efflux transporter [Ruegeria sp. 2205SS24-7]|uniref:chromate efflux transporter n=1 Tax=Ruegeria discodermiae TaxID=3064389 RepID=UPI002740D9F4|nr:chromate efflux transporter [Ruegeria sp. 2205SS24-7]MDP5216461.1 chromate efflux transporter [Ruegeria sp. 2205SS24-7]